MAKFVPFIISTETNKAVLVSIDSMTKADAQNTEYPPVWQTDWMSDYIQNNRFEKYALKTQAGELVALAAYEILENDVMVHITYIESQPESNPTFVGNAKKYQGIGRVLIASPLPSFGGAPRFELSGEAAMNVFITYLK